METLEQKIEAAKEKAQSALNAELKTIAREHTLTTLAPAGLKPPKWISNVKHSRIDSLRYEASSAQEVADIINAWRDTYGPFKPIGQYKTSCTIINAYPWGEYANIAPVAIEADAVNVRNSVGRGFSSLEFNFYPAIEGERIEVSISMAFRVYIPPFQGSVYADYDRYGNPRNVRKNAPPAWRAAAYSVNFSAGSDDAANFDAVFNYDALMSELNTAS